MVLNADGGDGGGDQPHHAGAHGENDRCFVNHETGQVAVVKEEGRHEDPHTDAYRDKQKGKIEQAASGQVPLIHWRVLSTLNCFNNTVNRPQNPAHRHHHGSVGDNQQGGEAHCDYGPQGKVGIEGFAHCILQNRRANGGQGRGDIQNNDHDDTDGNHRNADDVISHQRIAAAERPCQWWLGHQGIEC